MNKGWIKLRRSLVDWEWYDDHNATRLLIHLLITVNYEDKKWKGITIKKGSMVLSWETLSNSIGLTVRQCRTAMSKLISSGEVTKQVTSKYQVVTLIKWEKFQIIDSVDDKEDDRQMTGERQANDRQMTTTKETKNIRSKETKNKNNSVKNEKHFSLAVNSCFENVLNYFPEDLKPKTESQKNKWLETIEKLNRIDKWEFQDIEAVVLKTRSDNFWKKNFLSITKLRKKNNSDVKYIDVFFNKFRIDLNTSENYLDRAKEIRDALN